MKHNVAYINIGLSCETAEFICDSVKHWWKTKGSSLYPKATKTRDMLDFSCIKFHTALEKLNYIISPATM